MSNGEFGQAENVPSTSGAAGDLARGLAPRCCFERVNGCHTLRLCAPRRIGLPYGIYPRLLLAYLTTAAVRTNSAEIHLGATPNDLARNLGLSTISGPRGTAHRLDGSASPAVISPVQMENLSRSSPNDLWIQHHCCEPAGPVAFGARAPPWAVSMASPGLSESGFLRRDHALSCTDRPASPRPSQSFSPRHRPLCVAHLPDELLEEARGNPMGESPGPVRGRLWPAT